MLICNLLFVIRYSSFVIRYSSFAIRYLLFAICHLLFDRLSGAGHAGARQRITS
jgi:hypothetical protein